MFTTSTGTRIRGPTKVATESPPSHHVSAGGPCIQKRIRKNLDLDRVREVFRFTRRAGVEVLGYFMVGNPDETVADTLSGQVQR